MLLFGQIPHTHRSMHRQQKLAQPCLLTNIHRLLRTLCGNLHLLVADHGRGAEQFMSTSLFPSSTRPAGANGAYGNGTGYLLGGYSSAGTSQETARLRGFVPRPGRVFYDIEAGTWKNESAPGYSSYGTGM
jgi:hypothetical protein